MRLKILILTLILLLGTASGAYAGVPDTEVPIELVINGKYIKTGDTMPVRIGDVTYVPLKTAARAMGSDAVWNSDKGCVEVYVDSATVIDLYTDHGVVHSQEPDWQFDGGYSMINDVSYVPSRLLVYMLGGDLYWDTTYYNIVISRSGIEVPAELVNTFYGDDELYWLSRIIQAESSGEPFSGKLAVGNVIMNRVDSAEFPDSIIGVIFEKSQFQPVSSGKIHNTPSHDSMVAAKMSLRGTEVVGKSLFFFNPRIAKNNWISSNRYYYTSIGNHDFYL